MKPLLLSPGEVCERLGLPKPPEGLRRTRLGPHTVRYYREDVEAWEGGWRPGPPPEPPEPTKFIRDFQVWAHEEGVVYWIADDEDSPVKVGWTRGNPARRLAALQTSCWLTLRVHGFLEAERGDEKDIHRALADYHIRGEWFEREPTLAYFSPLIPPGVPLGRGT